jgi:hypothetical protein
MLKRRIRCFGHPQILFGNPPILSGKQINNLEIKIVIIVNTVNILF